MLPNESPTYGSTAPSWGASETMKPSDEIVIIVSESNALPLDVLELVDSGGTPIAFSGVDMFVPSNGEACAHEERHYALDVLPSVTTRSSIDARTAPVTRSIASSPTVRGRRSVDRRP